LLGINDVSGSNVEELMIAHHKVRSVGGVAFKAPGEFGVRGGLSAFTKNALESAILCRL